MGSPPPAGAGPSGAARTRPTKASWGSAERWGPARVWRRRILRKWRRSMTRSSPSPRLGRKRIGAIGATSLGRWPLRRIARPTPRRAPFARKFRWMPLKRLIPRPASQRPRKRSRALRRSNGAPFVKPPQQKLTSRRPGGTKPRLPPPRRRHGFPMLAVTGQRRRRPAFARKIRRNGLKTWIPRPDLRPTFTGGGAGWRGRPGPGPGLRAGRFEPAAAASDGRSSRPEKSGQDS
jgi:hypothetical protein